MVVALLVEVVDSCAPIHIVRSDLLLVDHVLELLALFKLEHVGELTILGLQACIGS